MALPNQDDVTLQLADQENWTPATLAKAKRHFFAFVRAGLGAGADATMTRRKNEDEISVLFVRFLGNEAQQPDSLT